MNPLLSVLLFTSIICCGQSRKAICVDVNHKQRFWNDPDAMAKAFPEFVDRVKYMTGELEKTAKSVDLQLIYLKQEITPSQVAGCSVIFIHTPSAKYSPGEVNAITTYVRKGGSLFLVMDEDYWSTLEQVNANDLIHPFDIQFAGQNPDTLSGGTTKAGLITTTALKIPFHGARVVAGGTPFCFDHAPDFPFGVYKELKDGGRLVVMGEGMVSLYMTSWENVNDYQCAEFMHDVFKWLVKNK